MPVVVVDRIWRPAVAAGEFRPGGVPVEELRQGTAFLRSHTFEVRGEEGVDKEALPAASQGVRTTGCSTGG